MRNKYGARKSFFGGHKFDSKKEMERYIYLLSLEQKGEITNLKMQVTIELQEKFTDNQGKKHREIRYIADFSYNEDGKLIYEDVKGFATPLYKMKMKVLQHSLKDQTAIIFKEIK